MAERSSICGAVSVTGAPGAVGAGHARHGVLGHERRCLACRCGRCVARVDRLRRQGGRLLAGVRTGGKGRDHRAAAARPPGRTRHHQTAADLLGSRRTRGACRRSSLHRRPRGRPGPGTATTPSPSAGMSPNSSVTRTCEGRTSADTSPRRSRRHSILDFYIGLPAHGRTRPRGVSAHTDKGHGDAGKLLNTARRARRSHW